MPDKTKIANYGRHYFKVIHKISKLLRNTLDKFWHVFCWCYEVGINGFVPCKFFFPVLIIKPEKGSFMATNFNPGHVTSPQLLQRVSPEILLCFLKKYKDFLSKEGVMPPSPNQIDYDRLSGVLASPSEQMPAELLADLVYWDEVSQMATDEELRDEAEKYDVEINEQATQEEIALLVRMKAPDAIEDLHAILSAHCQLRKKKRFYSYCTKIRPLPKWRKPNERQIDEFCANMDMWYDGQKKGRGVRVLPVQKGSSIWFIVRHGGTFKRENAIENGEPTIVFYRPEDYDLLIYHHKRGELEIFNSSNGKRERNAYCTNIGKSFFDDPDFFEKDDLPRYSLEPLRSRGKDALDCEDIEGIQSARLTDLSYRFSGGNAHRVSHRAKDVFEGLEDQGLGIPEGSTLESMTVKVTPEANLTRERRVKLQWPNISIYDHENDAELMRNFLVEQKFVIQVSDDGQ